VTQSELADFRFPAADEKLLGHLQASPKLWQ
jgi:hypothetical protein